MDIDPRQLSCLLMIAQQGSFSRAAEHAKLSQPALSRTVAQLERTVGARVLERGRFGARLNELGMALARHAEAVEVQLRRAGEEAALHREKLGGTLIVGVTPITAVEIVPAAVSRLAERRPGVSIRILELPFERGRAALKRGEIDLYVGPLQQLGEPSDFSEETILTDPLCVVVASSHPLAARRSLTLEKISPHNWALPIGSNALVRQLQALFLTASLPYPRATVTTDSMLALRGLVESGRFVTVMPKTLVRLECEAGRLRAIRLDNPGNSRIVGLAWSSDRPLGPLTLALIEELRALGNSRRLTRQTA
jgi:DNA-binding transcriptional LysR family regulator